MNVTKPKILDMLNNVIRKYLPIEQELVTENLKVETINLHQKPHNKKIKNSEGRIFA